MPSKIICLGEDTHGNDAINQYKIARLQELAACNRLNNLFFESPFTDATIALLEHKTVDYFIYPFWRTTRMGSSLPQLVTQHNTNAFGFDLQENCSFKEFHRFLFRQKYLEDNIENQRLTHQVDSLFAIRINAGTSSTGTRNLTAAEFALLTARLDLLQQQLRDGEAFPLIQQCFLNRKVLAHFINMNDFKDKINLRDSMMAQNLLFLQNYFHADTATTIIWAANTHVRKTAAFGNQWAKQGVYAMIEQLPAPVKNQAYSIGIYGKGGKAADGFDQVINLNEVQRISKEAFTNYRCSDN